MNGVLACDHPFLFWVHAGHFVKELEHHAYRRSNCLLLSPIDLWVDPAGS